MPRNCLHAGAPERRTNCTQSDGKLSPRGFGHRGGMPSSPKTMRDKTGNAGVVPGDERSLWHTTAPIQLVCRLVVEVPIPPCRAGNGAVATRRAQQPWRPFAPLQRSHVVRAKLHGQQATGVRARTASKRNDRRESQQGPEKHACMQVLTRDEPKPAR